MSSTKFKQNLDVTGDISLSGNIVIGGNTLAGDIDTDSVTFNADITSHIIPDANATYDMGTSTKTWREIFTSKVNSAAGDDLDIHSGSDIALYPAGNIWIKQQTKLIFEGTSPDDFEAKLQATSITADRDIILPDASGTITLNETLTDGTFDLDVNSVTIAGDTPVLTAQLTDGTLDLDINSLTISGAGITSIAAGSDITLDATNRVSITDTPFRLANMTTLERDAVIAANGDMIYNTDTNKIQGYTADSDGLGTPGWVDLH